MEQGVTDAYQAVGSPFVCAGVTGLMFGAVVTGFTGETSPTLAVTGAWRGFDSGDTTTPDAWTDLDSNTFTADGRANLTTAATTTTGKMLMQPGVKLTTGGGFKAAAVDLIVAAKK